MIRVRIFTFNMFEENTYVLYDETKECIIIDPGCYDREERNELISFIEKEGLKPVKLINTHCHIDHIFGNKFISEKYALQLEIHTDDLVVLNASEDVGKAYGIPMEPSPQPGLFLKENDMVNFGNSQLKVLFTPGHSPGSISFFSEKDNFVIVGDVLFYQSIGRYDFPGGDHDTLISSIKNKLFPLGDNVKVYPGHGPETSIGSEKKNNPFLK